MSTIPSAPFDGVRSFKRVTNVMNVYEYPHYMSQIFGGISILQWRKAERYRRFQRLLLRSFVLEWK